MPISAKAAAEVLGWHGHDIHTLLYMIVLDGADSKEDWDYDLICELIRNASENMERERDEKARHIALELAIAIGAIQEAKRRYSRRYIAKERKMRAQKITLK